MGNPISWETEAEKLLVRDQCRFHLESMPPKLCGIRVRDGSIYLLCKSKRSTVDSSVLISIISGIIVVFSLRVLVSFA